MTQSDVISVRTSFLAILLLAAGPADAPQSVVLTLISPNEQEHGYFGESVAGAGDVDRDGFADLIVGAYGEEPGGFGEGRAYVFSGRDRSLLLELVSPHVDISFGSSVAGAGDVNLDGRADLIVGAPLESPGNSPEGAGRCYVFNGQDGSLLLELASRHETTNGNFGQSVAGAGDVNKDGFADLIVGAYGEGSGRAYVFSGRDGDVLFELESPAGGIAWFGLSVARGGDVNQDGRPDLLVGAPHGSNGPNRAGLAYLFSGADASLLLAFASPNEQVTGFFGWSVAAAGDISSDGIADMIVGAWGEYSGSGRAYVLSGSDGSVLFQLTSPNSEPSGRFGYSVAAPGDVSQDGIPDVIVGAELEGPNNNGRAHAFSGQDGSVLSTLVSPNDGTGDGFFGKSIAGARDINRDGVPDLIVGAPVENPGNSPPNAGRAYVFLSPAAFRMNSGGPNYTDANGDFFVGDRAYELGGVGYVGGHQRHFSQPIGGTDDDPLYQDVRMARGQDSDGSFAYRFDVASSGLYGVTLFLMAPALEGAGSVVMDVQAEQDVAIDDLDVTAEAGGEYQALVKTFAVDVEDGTLDLRFRAVNKAAVVSAIAVEAQAPAGADLGLRRSAAR